MISDLKKNHHHKINYKKYLPKATQYNNIPVMVVLLSEGGEGPELAPLHPALHLAPHQLFHHLHLKVLHRVVDSWQIRRKGSVQSTATLTNCLSRYICQKQDKLHTYIVNRGGGQIQRIC